MADIIKNPEFDKLVLAIQKLETELAALVLDRDSLLYHVCPKLQTEYMLKIGKLEYAVFEHECKILRGKRKIEMIQAMLNKEEKYDVVKIDKQLDNEYKEYTQKLIEKQKEINEARLKKSAMGKLLTKEETTELKSLYTQIVKKLHPDINPSTTVEQHEHFIDAVNAYKNADLPEMRIIHLLINKVFVTGITSTMEKLVLRKELLIHEKDYLEGEINQIKETFPYSVMDLLQNTDKLNEKITELGTQLTDLKTQYENIEKRLQSILGSGDE